MGKKKITGVVFYEGPSRIDGAPIIGIATFGTSNEKTGNLVQTWILRSDVHPIDAINSGEDASICGSCPLLGLDSASIGANEAGQVRRRYSEQGAKLLRPCAECPFADLQRVS